MRLMLHIFKKDARRLWWANATSLVALAALAGFDSGRTNVALDSGESLLNLLVPVFWAFVAVLVIQDEAPVGDRQFWIARPYPWAVLLGAKALALVTFIHVPSFAADCAVLVARGFDPLLSLPTLFAKQVTFALAVTVPAAALATVTRNLVQFVSTAVVVVGAVVFLDGTLMPSELFWASVGAGQRIIPLVCVAITGAVMLFLQYSRRRTNLARGLAAVGLLGAGLTCIFVPREYVFRTQCVLLGLRIAPQPASMGAVIGKKPNVRQHRTRALSGNTAILWIPLRLSGMDQTLGMRGRYSEQLDLELIGSNGEKWRGPYFSFSGPFSKGRILFSSQGEASIFLMLDRSFYDRIKDVKVTIRGKVGLTFYRWREPVRMPALSDSTPVLGLGRCSSWMEVAYEEHYSLRTLCESPSEVAAETRVKLIRRDGGHSWVQQLADSSALYPQRDWLSPLYRAQMSLSLETQSLTEIPGSQLIPRDAPLHGEIEVVPAAPCGAMIVNYELRELDLREYISEPD